MLSDPAAANEGTLFFVGLTLALFLLAFFALPMLSGLVYTFDDLGYMHLPMRSFFAECLHNGRNYNWWPAVHRGCYLQGEGQAGMYHPLHRFLYGTLDLATAFDIELFLSYPVMLAGVYFILRRWALRRDSSIFGAALFAFSGFNLLHFMHMHVIAILAQMPWLLFAIDVSLRTRDRRRAAIANLAITLLTASQILLSHLQFVLFSSMVEVLYVLLLRPAWGGVRPLAALAVAKVLGVLAAGVQLLPNYDALTNSDRWNSPGYSSSRLSLPPLNLLQLVGPYLFDKRIVPDDPSANTHEYGLYAGAATLALFIWLALHLPKAGEKRRLAIAAVAFTLFALVMTLGRYAGLYVIFSKIPLVGSFRAPVRYIELTQLGLAVSAALAFESFATGAPQARPRSRRWLWLLVLPAAAVVAAVLSGRLGSGAAPGWAVLSKFSSTDVKAILAGPILCILGTGVVLAASRGARVALVVLIAFALGDQAIYGFSYINASPPTTLAAYVDSIRLPWHETFFRVEVVPTTDNVATLKGFRLVTGYLGLTPRHALDYTDAQALRLASTAYRIVKVEEPSKDGGTVGTLRLDPVAGPMPRARLVSRAVVAGDPARALASVDIMTTAIVGEDAHLDGGAAGTVSVTRDLPGDISIAADASGRQLLVVSESFHSGWRAAIDGKSAGVVRAYGDFIGVVVEKGRHEVALEFRPASLHYGKLVSLIGLILTMTAFIAELLVPRRAAL